MKISAIVAISQNNVIGQNNQLPWHLPADLQHFKSITMGKPILMGRKTFQSIGRPLPGRQNIILTQDKNFIAKDCIIAHSIAEALQMVAKQPEIFIIGGAALFVEMLPHIDTLYLTLIHHTFEGDTFFPVLNKEDWQEIERTDFVADERNPYPFSFITLKRSNNIL